MGYKVNDVEGFAKNLVKIARKYPSSLDLVDEFFSDLEELKTIEELDEIGEHVPGLKLKGDRVYKTRLRNPDANKGTSGGFRVIWYLVTSDDEIFPLTIYSKSDQEDISNREITMLIRRYLV